MFTWLTKLLTGAVGLTTTGLLTTAGIAFIVTDDIAIEQQDASPVSVNLGSGSVLTPTIAQFAQSGSANLGFVARIQSPQSYTSGALLRFASVQCGRKADVQLLSIGIHPQTNAGASGSLVIKRRVSAGTGAAVDTLTGAGIKVNDGNYLVALSETGASYKSVGDCVLKAEWSELYTMSH